MKTASDPDLIFRRVNELIGFLTIEKLTEEQLSEHLSSSLSFIKNDSSSSDDSSSDEDEDKEVSISMSLQPSVDDKFSASLVSESITEGTFLTLRNKRNTTNINLFINIAKIDDLTKLKIVNTEKRAQQVENLPLTSKCIIITTSDSEQDKYFMFYNNAVTATAIKSEDTLKNIQFGVENYCLNKIYQLVRKVVLSTEKAFIVIKTIFVSYSKRFLLLIKIEPILI